MYAILASQTSTHADFGVFEGMSKRHFKIATPPASQLTVAFLYFIFLCLINLHKAFEFAQSKMYL